MASCISWLASCLIALPGTTAMQKDKGHWNDRAKNKWRRDHEYSQESVSLPMRPHGHHDRSQEVSGHHKQERSYRGQNITGGSNEAVSISIVVVFFVGYFFPDSLFCRGQQEHHDSVHRFRQGDHRSLSFLRCKKLGRSGPARTGDRIHPEGRTGGSASGLRGSFRSSARHGRITFAGHGADGIRRLEPWRPRV
jgi:hypothetical protein